MSHKESLLPFPVATTLADPDKTSKLERELRHIGGVITIFAYVSFVVSVVCIGIIGGIFFTSTTLSPDRKAFFLGIIGVSFAGLISVIIISKHHPTTLLLFNILLSIISAFTLGLSITYAS
jgi:hypothetical protein